MNHGPVVYTIGVRIALPLLYMMVNLRHTYLGSDLYLFLENLFDSSCQLPGRVPLAPSCIHDEFRRKDTQQDPPGLLHVDRGGGTFWRGNVQMEGGVNAERQSDDATDEQPERATHGRLGPSAKWIVSLIIIFECSFYAIEHYM